MIVSSGLKTVATVTSKMVQFRAEWRSNAAVQDIAAVRTTLLRTISRDL